MPVKRQRGKQYAGPAKKKFKTGGIKAQVEKIVKSRFHKMVESKRAVHTSTDGLEIFHNNFITMDGNLLETTQGVKDPMANALESRIGDELLLKGVSIKFMVEMNERYSDVTFRMFVIKKAKGDTCDRSTFFAGLSGNKMIDTINTERFTVIKSKTFKMTAANNTFAYDSAGAAGTFTANATSANVYSRPTKIVKLYIPGEKLARGGRIRYENGSSQPKFFDYVVLLFAYSNYGTSQDVYYVGRLNDYVRTLYYKDA